MQLLQKRDVTPESVEDVGEELARPRVGRFNEWAKGGGRLGQLVDERMEEFEFRRFFVQHDGSSFDLRDESKFFTVFQEFLDVPFEVAGQHQLLLVMSRKE